VIVVAVARNSWVESFQMRLASEVTMWPIAVSVVVKQIAAVGRNQTETEREVYHQQQLKKEAGSLLNVNVVGG
jgi:hypothetical protein